MVIALLALLGVDLIVIVVLLGIMLSRRRWVSHQPGAFKGAVRVVDGEVPGLGTKWQRGYGRWSAMCSSGPRRRCCSATSRWPLTALQERRGRPSRVRSSGSGATR